MSLWSWVKRKILVPMRIALKNGISHRRLAASLALGITIGLIPFYGLTTILVGLVAYILRLDFVIMQVVHYAVHPLQIALLIPFFKAGNMFFSKDQINFTFKEYIHFFKIDFWSALAEFWKLNLSAIIVWGIIAVPLCILLYRAFFYYIRKFAPLLIRKPFYKAK